MENSQFKPVKHLFWLMNSLVVKYTHGSQVSQS